MLSSDNAGWTLLFVPELESTATISVGEVFTWARGGNKYNLALS